MEPDVCKYCDMPILWIKTPDGRKIAIDPTPISGWYCKDERWLKTKTYIPHSLVCRK